MRRSWCWGVVAILFAGPAIAEEPNGKTNLKDKIVRELWDAAYLQGEKTGYFHTTIQEFKRDGKTFRRVTQVMHMTVRRGGALASIDAENGDEETLDGTVVGVFFRMGLARDQMVNNVGKIDGKVMRVTIQEKGKPDSETKVPWDDTVNGMIAEENLLLKRTVKPGDVLTYRIYSPAVNNVVTTVVRVKDWENLPLNGKVRKLLRVELKPDKIDGFQLPSQTLWYDDEYHLVQSQVEMPGLGELMLVRTDQKDALKPIGKVPDLFAQQSIVLNKRIANPHGQSAIVYKVTLAAPPEDISDIGKMFATGDGRQQIKNITKNSFELHVKAVRGPTANAKPGPVDKQFTESNFFVNCDDELVRKIARNAVGKETEPWNKARLIESFVKNYITNMNFDSGIATADWVARNREGDCKQFGMLTAAMCRAEGIPSRTAVGLVYHVDRDGTPKLSYHMWAEVNIKGQWIGLDATLGMNQIGAAHLKISDSSWYETRSFTPMLPLMRFMSAQPKVEILKVGE
jgi:hypothetical protein